MLVEPEKPARSAVALEYALHHDIDIDSPHAGTTGDQNVQPHQINASRAPRAEGLPLVGPFEHRVLIAIRILRSESYGAKVRRYLSKELGKDVAIGQVYITLSRLQEKGYVTSKLTTPEPIRGGRAKRVFQLEAPGVKALEIAAAAIHAAGALQQESSHGPINGEPAPA